jgi:hypothetical protein
MHFVLSSCFCNHLMNSNKIWKSSQKNNVSILKEATSHTVDLMRLDCHYSSGIKQLEVNLN